ncbi:MAG: glycosyltransferase family 39 protein [Deltaproteobacteria bacterium]|nr:glycosyltransferase family 39 protein [Deltaproteobacteria bacterium]
MGRASPGDLLPERGGLRDVRAKHVRAASFRFIFQAAAALAIARLGARWYGRRAGAAAGALFATVYFLGYGYWDLANGDIYTVLPAALALLALGRHDRGPRWGWDAFAGACVTAVVLVRYTHGLFLVPVVVSVFLDEGNGSGRAQRIAKRLAWISAGGIASTAIFLGHLAMRGALTDFFEALFVFAPGYAQTATGNRPGALLGIGIVKTVGFALRSPLLVIPAFFTFARAFHEDRRSEDVLCGVWALAAMGGLGAMAKYFPYHWFAIFPVLAIASGRTIADALRPHGRLWRRVAVGVLRRGFFHSHRSRAGRPDPGRVSIRDRRARGRRLLRTVRLESHRAFDDDVRGAQRGGAVAGTDAARRNRLRLGLSSDGAILRGTALADALFHELRHHGEVRAAGLVRRVIVGAGGPPAGLLHRDGRRRGALDQRARRRFENHASRVSRISCRFCTRSTRLRRRSAIYCYFDAKTEHRRGGYFFQKLGAKRMMMV